MGTLTGKGLCLWVCVQPQSTLQQYTPIRRKAALKTGATYIVTASLEGFLARRPHFPSHEI